MPRFPYAKTDLLVEVFRKKGKKKPVPVKGATVSVDGIPLPKKTDAKGKLLHILDPGYYAIGVDDGKEQVVIPVLTKAAGGKERVKFVLFVP